jgi:XRE family transcriptional regulator, fatty acid utilization regulator
MVTAEMPATLGERLRHIRIQRELSQVALAQQVGCSQSLLSEVERDIKEPSYGMLVRLATALNITAGLLAGDIPDVPMYLAQGSCPAGRWLTLMNLAWQLHNAEPKETDEYLVSVENQLRQRLAQRQAMVQKTRLRFRRGRRAGVPLQEKD